MNMRDLRRDVAKIIGQDRKMINGVRLGPESPLLTKSGRVRDPDHRSEHVEQSFLIQRLALLERKWPELELGYAIPNGGWRTKAQGGKLKAEGVKPSVPDYCLPVPRWPFHGLYIEMKEVGKYATADQREFQRRLLEQGYAVLECQGDEPAYRAVNVYLELSQWGDRTGVARAEKVDSLTLMRTVGDGLTKVRWRG